MWAAQFAGAFGARLTLADIAPGEDIYGPDGFDFGPEGREKLIRLATQRIAKLQQETGTKAEVVIESGDVAKLLNQVARQTDGDVLVIGRPPHGRLRSTGYGIIRESNIPVLSV